MRLAGPCAIAIAALALAPRPAAAQHDHHGGHHHGGGGDGQHGGGQHGGGHHHGEPAPAPRSSFGASIGVLAAGYDTMLYSGDYEGLAVTGRWSRGRFAASAGITGYSLRKNGKRIAGVGDLMLHGHAMLVSSGAVTAGAMLMVMTPTGDHEAGLGMGHVMLMPGAWAQWSPGRLSLGASAGYSRGIGDAGLHAEHAGGWPLVDPMSFSELTLGATGTLSLARALRAGVRVDGAIPIGDGASRLSAGVRAMWKQGRFETTAELQGGLVGAPFDVRGLLETAVHFD
jgi:hypothetical protein